MNTIEELITMGFPESTAKRMLASYKSHIGEMHGVNRVTDVTYVGNGMRDVELTCTLCGFVYHKKFSNTGSKWGELRKTCSCQTVVKEDTGKSYAVRNDDPQYLNKVYGDYKVVDFANIPHKNKSGSTVFWMCECIHCGKISKNIPSNVRSGRVARCSCQKEAEAKAKWNAEIGKKYNRLTVIGIEHRLSGRYAKPYAICNCDCGRSVTTQIQNVKLGITKSCGCIEEEILEKAKDGRAVARSKSPLYGTWSGMKARCFNEKNRNYKDYGGRGITVCPDWLGPEGFDRFEAWSYENGYKPESGLSLDRIDVNGNYEPSNCRYANIHIQAVNKRPAKRRTVKTYAIDGEEKTLNQWCSKYHISDVAVKYRMNTLGMTLEEALKTPKTRKGNIYAGKQAKERVADINKCNSYIEANLYLAFIRTTGKYKLEPQYAVGKYHADFLVWDTDILVECDGYDYHKTREQMASDYERERFFTMNGYRVIRFTGTEINNDPERCCREIIDVIEALYEPSRQTNAG